MSTRKPNLNDYYELTQITELSVSPDGSRIAFVADEFDSDNDERCQSLFVTPADGSADPHRLTRVSDANQPKWSPDGAKLGFIATRDTDVAIRTEKEFDGSDEAESDEEPNPQVWEYDLERGGDARQVTEFDEGVREFDWSPEGNQIVTSARDPTEEQQEYLDQRKEDGPIETQRLQHKYDGVGWLDDVKSYLFVVDVDSREVSRLDEAYGSGAHEPRTGLSPAWSPAGDRITFLSNRVDRPDDSNAMDVYTVRPDGTGLERLTNGDVTAGGGQWDKNGEQFAFGAGTPTNGYEPTELYVADVDAGTYESISESLDRPLSYGAPFSWTGDNTLLSLVGDEGRTRLVRLFTDGTEPSRVFEAQGKFQDASQFGYAGGTVALCLSSPGDSTDVYTMDIEEVDAPQNDPTTRLTDVNSDLLERYEPPETRWITFDSEGQEVEALTYFPPGYDPEEGNGPLIVTIHGGPISYDSPAFNYDYTYWTNKGYVLLRVNYRGSSSYGQEFSQAIEGDWGHWEPTDVINGIEDVLSRGWADPDRVFVTGFSYGGAQTAYILSQSDLATAGAAEHGIYDRHAYFGTGDSHNRMERDFGVPWENFETYKSISSITDVGDIDAPLLITAGGEDWRCPPTQSEQLYVSVKKQGVPAKLIVYPDEHHNVGDPDRAIHRLRHLTGWFEEYDPANT